MENSLFKVVLDTNIIVSALVFGGNSKKIIEKLIQRQFKAYTSPQLVSELIDILIKKFHFSDKMITLLEAEIIALFTTVYPEKEISIVRDNDDNRVLEVAVESNSKIIVTGDNDLLDLQKYENIAILSPKEFLDFINLQNL